MINHEDNIARKSILTALTQATKNAAQMKATSPPRSTCINKGGMQAFESNLVGNGVRVDRIHSAAQAVALIAQFLQHQKLAPELRTCLPLTRLDWQSSAINAQTGSTNGHDPVCVSEAYAGIEDTGTLVILSSADNPTLLNFLPDHHIVLLAEHRVVKAKADLWKLLQQEQQQMPRALHMISGPSRTADIEQTIQLGAHGPRSLWLILFATP